MAIIYICQQCGFKTEVESDLDRHIERLHNGNIK